MQVSIDPAAVADALANDPDVQQHVEEVANQVMADVVDLTPVRATEPSEHDDAAAPGTFQESIEVVDSPDTPGAKRVQATDPRFHWVEFGTGMRENRAGANRGEMPPFAPFRRAAETYDGYRPEGE